MTDQEGPLTFYPTYKRNSKGEGYVNKKEQPPSWTDRILFKDNKGLNVHTEHYLCIENLLGR